MFKRSKGTLKYIYVQIFSRQGCIFLEHHSRSVGRRSGTRRRRHTNHAGAGRQHGMAAEFETSQRRYSAIANREDFPEHCEIVCEKNHFFRPKSTECCRPLTP